MLAFYDNKSAEYENVALVKAAARMVATSDIHRWKASKAVHFDIVTLTRLTHLVILYVAARYEEEVIVQEAHGMVEVLIIHRLFYLKPVLCHRAVVCVLESIRQVGSHSMKGPTSYFDL